MLLFYSLWKERLNSEGQLFHQYQQSEQSPLTSTHWIQKKPLHMTLENPDPGLGQAQKCDRVIPVNGIPTLSLSIIVNEIVVL